MTSFLLRISNKRYRNLVKAYYNYFCCYLFLIAPLAPLTQAVISSNSASVSSNLQSKSGLIEGSGSILNDKAKDLSEWQASGVNPDDEPGDDVEEGSGAVEGSGVSTQSFNESSTGNNIPIIPKKPETVHNKADIHSFTHSTSDHVIIPSDPPSLYNKSTTPINQQNANILYTTTPYVPFEPQFVVTTTVKTFTTTAKTTTTVATTKKPLINLNTRTPPSQSDLPPYVTETDSFEMLKPGILAAVSGGAVVGVLLTILLVMFIVYRMRKKDEGSYSLDEPHQPPNYSYAYQKASTKEFYA